MAGKTAILSVRIVSDGSQSATGFKTAEQATQQFESSLNTASIAAGVTLAGLTAISVQAVSAASDLQQSGGAMESVFGAHSEAIGKLADDAATRVGLAQSEYQQMAAVLGAQMKNLGIDEADLVTQTDDLITMGADLAAVFNGTTSEAVQALSALMRGERDPIERYGVTIKQAAVEAKLAEMGLDGLEGKAKTTAEAHATLALLAEQTGDAHGAFARELDTAAVSGQVASALWQDAAAQLGTALLPLVTEGAQLLAFLAQAFSQNSEVLVPLVVGLGGFVAVVAALVLGIKAYRTAAEIAAAAQVVWNFAMSANPIGLIIIAIVALIGFIILIASNWDEVRAIWGDAIASMIGWIEDLINWVIDAINWIGQLFGATDGLSNVDWGLDQRSAAAQSFTFAQAAPAAGPSLFSALSTRSTAPSIRSLVSAVPAAGSLGGPSAQPQNVYNVTINGAIDPEATGRQIRKVLDSYGKSVGSVAAGGGRWEPSTPR